MVRSASMVRWAAATAIICAGAGCSGTGSVNGSSGSASTAGTSGTSGSGGTTGSLAPPGDGGIISLDAGVNREPIAPGFGGFTGYYDVNGGGRLVAMQLDDALMLQIDGQPNLYLGTLADGGFSAEIAYADLEQTCGPLTVAGSLLDAGYVAMQVVCVGGTPAAGQISGDPFIGSRALVQDLALSGVYDITETPTSDNACDASSAGPFEGVLGLSIELDGGGAVAYVEGDGLLDEVEFGTFTLDGGADVAGVDSAGNLISAMNWGGAGTRYFGHRAFDLGTSDSPCPVDLALTGTRRTR